MESLLTVAYALVLGVATQRGSGSTEMALAVARIIAVFGILLTMTWAYALDPAPADHLALRPGSAI